jgi:outer membrane lipoprotein-sorting protein
LKAQASLILAVAIALGPGSAHGAGQKPSHEVSVPGVSPEERLATLLAHFDAAQKAIVTLQADFQERKDLAILKAPVLSTGHFYYSRPDRAKWEYISPDRKVFLINDNRLMQYFPSDKLLEKKDLRASNTTRLFKLFGLGQTSKQLADFYDIKLEDDSDQPGTYLLVLTPRRRVIEKRLAKVYLWVGDQDFLPRALKYQEGDGDLTHLVFSAVRVNEVLADATFTLDIPSDVRVRNEITLFTAGKKSAP